METTTKWSYKDYEVYIWGYIAKMERKWKLRNSDKVYIGVIVGHMGIHSREIVNGILFSQSLLSPKKTSIHDSSCQCFMASDYQL